MIDNYRFYSVTKTETVDGKRIEKLMAVHKVTGETRWFSRDEIEQMQQGSEEMTTNPAPGQITRGMTEYIFCCWVCNWREVIHAFTKDDAIKLARQAGWFTEFGKWRCVSHQLSLEQGQQVRK